MTAHFGTKKVIKKVIKFPKTDIRYWEGKVAFQTPASRTYSVQLQHAKHRSWINLGTPNKAQAAVEARKLYLDLRANGWEETLRRRRPLDVQEKKVKVTIGEYLDAVKAKSAIYSKTIEGYAVALRKIAADIYGLADTPEKKSPTHREAWRAKIDSIKLRKLTAEKIESWRVDFIKRRGTDPLKEKSARVSANSFIRRARSLFGAGVIARVRDIVEIPDPIPFTGVKVEKVRVPRASDLDMATLLKAREGLPRQNLNSSRSFFLPRWPVCGATKSTSSLGPRFAGTRASSGSKRRSSSGQRHPIQKATSWLIRNCSKSSEATSPGQRAGASLSSNPRCRPILPLSDHYRCQSDIQELTWLRSKGVRSKTPLHALRKDTEARSTPATA
jgi:hypothetical protein